MLTSPTMKLILLAVGLVPLVAFDAVCWLLDWCRIPTGQAWLKYHPLDKRSGRKPR